MSLKKIVVGLAVVGLVGVVNAAPPVPNSGTPVKTVVADQELSVSYEVVLLAEIKVTPTAGVLKDNSLLVNPSALVSATPNLGTVNVKTNYNAWDVVVNLTNGGLLKAGYGPSAKTLLANAAGDSAWLNVVIYALGNNNTPISASVVDLTDTLKILTRAEDPAVISFADVIGNAISGSFAPTDQAGSDIANDGFAMPIAAYIDSGITFGVCAGFNLGPDGKIVGANDEGVYSETLTFTLAATF